MDQQYNTNLSPRNEDLPPTIFERSYSVTGLIKEKWFPIKSYITVMNYIKSGKLKAVNMNSQKNKKINRLKIKHSDAVRFLLSLK